jgi:hypothetical protein
LPDPVGARMRVWSPAAMAGQPCSWAGVASAKEVVNHSSTAGLNVGRPTVRRVPTGGDRDAVRAPRQGRPGRLSTFFARSGLTP